MATSFTLSYDVSGLPADVLTIHLLARLRQHALQLGGDVEFRGISAHLRDLVGLCGLDEALRLDASG